LTEPSPPRSSAPLGALLIVAAFACVAVMSALGKAAVGVAAGMLVFFQSAISLCLLAPWAMHRQFSTLRTSRLGLHAVRAVAGLLSQVLMFVAVKKMPLADAVLLSNSAPLFIPLVTWIWLKEPIRGVVGVSLLLGFAGVILILRPSQALLENPVALIAITAALCSALALVSVNQLATTEPGWRILFYYFLFSSAASAPLAIWTWRRPSPREWLFLAGVGAMMAASQLLIILAYRHASAGRIAPFNYTVVLFSGLLGWVVWHDAPGMLALAGAVLVIAGGVLSTWFGGTHGSGHFGWFGRTEHFFHREDAT
jgi:drug/metabolite transporter (DMT)-like permease